jgi:NADH:ubiquinone oxidoreductase subunit 2 (subunit N)
MAIHAHREGFWRRALGVTLPLLVWIAHFAFSYGLAAAQCSPRGLRAGGPDRMLLGVVTAAAFAACALMAWRRRGELLDRQAGLARRAGALLAVLAAIAIAWAGIPLLLVAGCA